MKSTAIKWLAEQELKLAIKTKRNYFELLVDVGEEAVAVPEDEQQGGQKEEHYDNDLFD